MANTFSQIYIQAVFAVSGRQSLIRPAIKEELYKYITGIVRNQGQKLIDPSVLVYKLGRINLAPNLLKPLLRKFDIAFDEKYVFDFID